MVAHFRLKIFKGIRPPIEGERTTYDDVLVGFPSVWGGARLVCDYTLCLALPSLPGKAPVSRASIGASKSSEPVRHNIIGGGRCDHAAVTLGFQVRLGLTEGGISHAVKPAKHRLPFR